MWHLEEDYRVYCTLVQGKDLAILWDTGQGKQDLAAYLAERVWTPYLAMGMRTISGGTSVFPASMPTRRTGRCWKPTPA